MSRPSSPCPHTNKPEALTVPPKNSIPSSTLPTTSIFSMVVPVPTPPSVNPLISFPSPISAPPCLIETYLRTPELSAGSEPPYKPFVSEAGIPSICCSTTSPEKEQGAFPNINSPPHRPLTFSEREDPND